MVLALQRRRPGRVAGRRAGVRGGRVELLPAAGARHLVARPDRRRRGGRHPGRRRRGGRRGADHRRRPAAARLAGDAGRAAGRVDRAAGVRGDGRRVAATRRRAPPTSARRCCACTPRVAAPAGGSHGLAVFSSATREGASADVVRASRTGIACARGRIDRTATVERVISGEHAALSLRGLVKRFDGKVAVAGVDLDVPAGSFYGLLGPNGAGKTTTLSMAVGLLRPDAGRAVGARPRRVGRPGRGQAAARRAARRRAPLRPAHRGGAARVHTGCCAAWTRRWSTSGPRELLDVLALADAGRTLVVDYSAGMKKKIGLACALLHAPAAAGARRAVRGGRPGLGRADPRHPAAVRRRRRHGDLLQPRAWRSWSGCAATSRSWPTGAIKAVGTLDEVRGGRSLEEVFVEVVGGRTATGEELSWL